MFKQLKEYFVFSRKERIGFAVLVIIVAVIFVLPPLLKNKRSSTPAFGQIKKNDENVKEDKKRDEDNNYSSFEESNAPHSLFYFDPNSTSAADWKRLGLKDKTIHTIQNYLSKGGHFYKATDLQKIYGLRTDEFERLLPYIRLAETPQRGYEQRKYENKENDYKKDNNYPENKYPDNNTVTPYKKKAILIDINTSDTTAWISLPGIGSKLASRIVNFRDKLGGFYSILQVAETYGVPDSTFQLIKPMLQLNTSSVRKININTATKDELKAHPYIRWALANAIIEYRNQHGPFTSLEQLSNIVMITPEVYNKIAPYLSIN